MRHHQDRGLRRSGRTYKMLSFVLDRERHGRKSIVVCQSAKHRKDVEIEFRARCAPEEISPQHTVFTTPAGMRLDWETLTVPGVDMETTEVVVDHFAIETHLAKVLSELHRWDPEES